MWHHPWLKLLGSQNAVIPNKVPIDSIEVVISYCEGREDYLPIVDYVCAHVRIRRGGPLFVFYPRDVFHFHAVAWNRGEFSGRDACNTSV